MSEVTLQVGGRPYTVSCADGEEAHVQHLAAIIDGKLAGLGGNLAGEAKNLLFAALILADEVHEVRRRDTAGPTSSDGEQRATATLEALAVRLEHLAQVVENAAAKP